MSDQALAAVRLRPAPVAASSLPRRSVCRGHTLGFRAAVARVAPRVVASMLGFRAASVRFVSRIVVFILDLHCSFHARRFASLFHAPPSRFCVRSGGTASPRSSRPPASPASCSSCASCFRVLRLRILGSRCFASALAAGALAAAAHNTSVNRTRRRRDFAPYNFRFVPPAACRLPRRWASSSPLCVAQEPL